MDLTNLIGLLAGTMTTISFLPQVIKTWKSRSCKDISLVMFTFFALGLILWTIYGFITHALPVIVANTTTLGLVLIIIFFKIKYG
jgi:MtN3 and saliva related transmembrane protein